MEDYCTKALGETGIDLVTELANSIGDEDVVNSYKGKRDTL